MNISPSQALECLYKQHCEMSLGKQGSISTVVSWKRAHGRSTLQVCQRWGWALFGLFPHLTMKERPRHVYSNSNPSKQIIGHKMMYNGITNSFKVES